MRLRVRIIGQRRNLDGIDFRVEDENGEEWIILNCLQKITYDTMFGYFGSLGEFKHGFKEGYPANLNRYANGTWELLIE